MLSRFLTSFQIHASKCYAAVKEKTEENIENSVSPQKAMAKAGWGI